MNIYALIPARSGSKGIRNKNLCVVQGKSLLEYTIETALACGIFEEVIVTTDSETIAKNAKHLGAKVPFLRPSQFARDNSTDREYIEHAINWLKDNENIEPKLISILRPTTPLRDINLIESAVNLFHAHLHSATSLRSVHAMSEPPQKMLQITNGFLKGFFPNDLRKEYFNLPRQAFPKAYHPNGYIDIVKPDHIKTHPSGIFGEKILAFETPFSIEIDIAQDLEYLNYLLDKKNAKFYIK